MIRLFVVVFVIVVGWLLYLEYKKLNKKEDRRDTIDERLEKAEERLQDVYVKEQVLTAEELATKKERELSERASKLNPNQEGQ